MTDPSTTLPPGPARDAVERFHRLARDLRARTEAARAALSTSSATASSPDGAVRVSVDAGGALTGVAFGPAAADRDHETLARQVLAVARQARIDALAVAARRVADIVGVDSAALTVLRRQREELGAAPDAYPSVGDHNDEGWRR